MKRRTLALALACLSAGGFALHQNAADDHRVAMLESEVRALRMQLDETTKYAQKQAVIANALQKALVTSREKGFTYGINPQSREVMLAGFAEFLEGLGANVPKLHKAKAVPADGSRKGRSRITVH